MNIHIRFLMAKFAALTAIAGMLSVNTPEWDEVYKNRLYCEMRINLERVKDESKTGEKVLSGFNAVPSGSADVEEKTVVVNEPETGKKVETVTAPTVQVVDTPTEANPGYTDAETVAVETAVATQTVPVVTIDGDTLDPGIAAYFQQRLNESGIGWFFPYACMIAYQESSFNPLAENVNGRDKGLLQYRVEFYPGMDWRNPYQQIDVFCQQMAYRLNVMGCSIEDAISRHNMSDYGSYNPVYVQQVLSHAPSFWR